MKWLERPTEPEYTDPARFGSIAARKQSLAAAGLGSSRRSLVHRVAGNLWSNRRVLSNQNTEGRLDWSGFEVVKKRGEGKEERRL